MVKVSFEPVKELVIHEVLEVDYEDLMRERITPTGSAPLYWCNGVLFTFASMPFTDNVIKDYLEGRIHWAEVHYTRMKQYSPVLTLEDEHYSGAQKVRAIDTRRSALHRDFIRWLDSTSR